MTDNKIVKLTKVSDSTKDGGKDLNYEQCLRKHLETLTKEQREYIPGVLFVGGICSDSSMYQILAGDSIFEVIGCLEVLKNFLVYDNLGGD